VEVTSSPSVVPSHIQSHCSKNVETVSEDKSRMLRARENKGVCTMVQTPLIPTLPDLDYSRPRFCLNAMAVGIRTRVAHDLPSCCSELVSGSLLSPLSILLACNPP
jgi:hypothetical protein